MSRVPPKIIEECGQFYLALPLHVVGGLVGGHEALELAIDVTLRATRGTPNAAERLTSGLKERIAQARDHEWQEIRRRRMEDHG